MRSNSDNIEVSLRWLMSIANVALSCRFGKSEQGHSQTLSYCNDDSWLARFLQRQQPSSEEFVILMLALAPHLQPDFFNKPIAQHLPEGGDFPEFGGVKAGNHRGILPTGETAQFVLASDDLEKRLAVQASLSSEHWFRQKHILWLEPVREGEPVMSGPLILNPQIGEEITVGKVSRPRFSTEFPAEYIETQMDWDDVVLHPQTLRQIHEIENRIKHNDTLLYDWGMEKRVKHGYRTLFYGPPGTGKTLTATLLGKHTGKDVFRIDLSRVVSTYIGETEKNLSRLFDRAEHQNWILFFDEADALFGKRGEVKDARDRWANTEVNYLLQRIEDYVGVVILASNLRQNIDEAFLRRISAMVEFPAPNESARVQIWRGMFPPGLKGPSDEELGALASRIKVPGGSIRNIVVDAAFRATADAGQDLPVVTLHHLVLASAREFQKLGKPLTKAEFGDEFYRWIEKEIL